MFFKRRQHQFVYYKIDIIKYDETTENIDACYISCYCYCYNTMINSMNKVILKIMLFAAV